MTAFYQRLADAITTHNSLLCVGLDPDIHKLPAPLRNHPDAVYQFCADIILRLVMWWPHLNQILPFLRPWGSPVSKS